MGFLSQLVTLMMKLQKIGCQSSIVTARGASLAMKSNDKLAIESDEKAEVTWLSAKLAFVEKGGIRVLVGIPAHEIMGALERDREERMSRLIEGFESDDE
jgi:hypothetical protein